MLDHPSQRTYRIIVGLLVGIIVVVLLALAVAMLLPRYHSNRRAAAALAATADARPLGPPTPTATPVLAGVNAELLVCQRQASQAMVARRMVGAVNLSDDRRLIVQWFSLDWPISNLNSALAGVMPALDVALELWEEGCPHYDLVVIEVHDRRESVQAHRLTVQAQMDDVLRWRAGEIDDVELIERLEVIRSPEPGLLGQRFVDQNQVSA
jgi:hypothetical protein